MLGKKERLSFVVGRLHAQQDIMMAMFGYFMVLDESFARGMVNALEMAVKNVDKIIDGDNNDTKLGYTMEMSAFIVKIEHYMKNVHTAKETRQ